MGWIDGGYECFNPCCIGLAIAAVCPAKGAELVESFNPCCIGLAIAADSAELHDHPVIMFQSLLYWISHCGPPSGLPDRRCPHVSILVVLD